MGQSVRISMSRCIIMGRRLDVAVLNIRLVGLVFDRVNLFLHWIHNSFDWGDNFLNGRWVTSVSGSLDVNDEAGVLVRGVLDGAGGAVGLHQAIISLHLVSVTLLVLLLDVVCVFIFDAVFEFIVRGYL